MDQGRIPVTEQTGAACQRPVDHARQADPVEPDAPSVGREQVVQGARAVPLLSDHRDAQEAAMTEAQRKSRGMAWKPPAAARASKGTAFCE